MSQSKIVAGILALASEVGGAPGEARVKAAMVSVPSGEDHQALAARTVREGVNPELCSELMALGWAPPQRAQELARTAADFKSFHRSLCERFGYTHDEKDWKRDQVSLIEHIVTKASGPIARALATDFVKRAIAGLRAPIIQRRDALVGILEVAEEFLTGKRAVLPAAVEGAAADAVETFEAEARELLQDLSLLRHGSKLFLIVHAGGREWPIAEFDPDVHAAKLLLDWMLRKQQALNPPETRVYTFTHVDASGNEVRA